MATSGKVGDVAVVSELQPGDVSVVLSALERSWVGAALQVQRSVLVRSRQKERSGSEIDQLRGREIAELDRLIQRLAA